jgi:hypothetical protein
MSHLGKTHSVFDRVGFQRIQIHEFQHRDVTRLQHNRTGLAGFKGLRPTPHADAPTVAGRQAGKIIFGAGRDEVVALLLQIIQKRLGDLAADRVQSTIFRSGATITITVKPGHGRLTAAL